MNRVFACFVAVGLFAGCHRLSSEERLVVGVWTRPRTVTITDNEPPEESQEKLEIRFDSNGSYSWSVRGEPPDLTGRWWIDRGDLVTEIETQPKDGLFPRQRHERLVRVNELELVLSDGTGEGRWTRVR